MTDMTSKVLALGVMYWGDESYILEPADLITAFHTSHSITVREQRFCDSSWRIKGGTGRVDRLLISASRL